MTDPKKSLDAVLDRSSVVVVCGPGGVGKTTSAVALAVGIAMREPKRVLVITVDPARRLADSLSISMTGNDVHELDPSALTENGGDMKGKLFVSMVDAKASWDSLVAVHSSGRESAEKILANPVYEAFSSRFAMSHEYVAMERLFELYESETYDVIIVDTPPSKDALDFLDAPVRMAAFFSSRLSRWITLPARSRVAGIASRPFLDIANRILGAEFLYDIAEFFSLLQSMYGGFVDRADRFAALLHSPETSFVVVSTPEELDLDETARLAQEISRRSLVVSLLIANRLTPSVFHNSDALRLARSLVARESGDLASKLWADEGDELGLERVLETMASRFCTTAEFLEQEHERLREHRRIALGMTTVPYLPGEVRDMSGLLSVSHSLYSNYEHG